MKEHTLFSTGDRAQDFALSYISNPFQIFNFNLEARNYSAANLHKELLMVECSGSACQSTGIPGVCHHSQLQWDSIIALPPPFLSPPPPPLNDKEFH